MCSTIEYNIEVNVIRSCAVLQSFCCCCFARIDEMNVFCHVSIDRAKNSSEIIISYYASHWFISFSMAKKKRNILYIYIWFKANIFFSQHSIVGMSAIRIQDWYENKSGTGLWSFSQLIVETLYDWVAIFGWFRICFHTAHTLSNEPNLLNMAFPSTPVVALHQELVKERFPWLCITPWFHGVYG